MSILKCRTNENWKFLSYLHVSLSSKSSWNQEGIHRVSTAKETNANKRQLYICVGKDTIYDIWTINRVNESSLYLACRYWTTVREKYVHLKFFFFFFLSTLLEATSILLVFKIPWTIFSSNVFILRNLVGCVFI